MTPTLLTVALCGEYLKLQFNCPLMEGMCKCVSVCVCVHKCVCTLMCGMCVVVVPLCIQLPPPAQTPHHKQIYLILQVGAATVCIFDALV